ncbi:MAG: hypothetical protein E8D41_01345 [Nitrospira sp.]|nr:MAG: hypothetical protein E8D41_01345 [Nitrospira sp.]
MCSTKKSGNTIVTHPHRYRAVLVGALLAYLALALPLPFLLLDHEVGLLTGDPSHSVHDDHAWLDHAAGTGLASGEAEIVLIDIAALFRLFPSGHVQSPIAIRLSVRGPPDLSL